MQRTQLSINSVSTTHSGLEEALAAYAGAGFRLVEFVMPLVKNYLAHDHTLDDVRALLARYQLRSIGGFETHLVCFGTSAERQVNVDLLVHNAHLIHEFGGGTMVVGTDGPEQISLSCLDQIAKSLRELAERIEGFQVNIALEFNWSPVVKSLQSAALVVNKVWHPQVGILFDPAHYYTTVTKLEHLTADTVSLIKHVHLDDMRDKPGELSNCNSDRVLPGQGILDLGSIIARLEQFGYNGFYSIEMFNEELWKMPASEAAALCYKSLLPLCRE
jgi:sugar phosphate isomerase/epimerase